MGGVMTCTLSGELWKDPEMTYEMKKNSSDGYAMTKFSMPVEDYNYSTGEKSTRWINCVSFGNVAERIGNHQRKGAVLSLSGEYTVRLYKGKDNKPAIGHDFKVSDFKVIKWAPKSGNGSAGDSSAGSDSDWDMSDLDGVKTKVSAGVLDLDELDDHPF